MAQIWDHGPQNQGERFVLLALADFANDAGECWPSIAGIRRKTCMSERGVQTVLRRLEDAGWLEVEAGGGRKNCNRYTIKTPQEMQGKAAETPQEMPPQEMRGYGKTPQMDAETPQMDAENPAPDAPEPSRTIIEPSEEPPCIPPTASKPVKARMPDDWVLDDDGWAYARSLQLRDDEIQEIADDFQAYWFDRTDRDGRKSERGWRQCWRNRVRSVAAQFIRNRGVAFPARTGGYGQSRSIAGVVARRRLDG